MKKTTSNDALGKFLVIDGKDVFCGFCHKNVPTAITYQSLEPEKPYENIDLSYTILGKENKTLGIECGCYGKLHRQVAHIQTKMSQTHHSQKKDHLMEPAYKHRIPY